MTATPFAPGPSAALPTFLALPKRFDVSELARAWFPEAAWVREPGRAPARQAAVGARFRGMVTESRALPGELRLTWASHLEGPLDAEALAEHGVSMPGTRSTMVYRLVIEAGAPHDPRLTGWLRAAARRSGGAVRWGAESVEQGVPESAVDLAIYSPVPVSPEVSLGLVRAVVPGARAASAPGADEGIAPYTLELPTQFDGSVELRFARAGELPVSLLQLDWREYGPFGYRVVWVPSDELGDEPDEQLLRIARSRVRPVVARVAFAMTRAAAGAVVDADGFVLSRDEIVSRAVAF